MRFIFLLLFVLASSEAFHSILSPQRKISAERVASALYDSKEEEIAKLEEQLKKLKEETQEESKEVMIAEVDEESKLEEAEEVVPEEMFLTERWKEEEGEASEGGGLTGILSAVGVALFLTLFSQIPIGQEDLSKYSVGTQTEQIDLGDLNRARNTGDL